MHGSVARLSMDEAHPVPEPRLGEDCRRFATSVVDLTTVATSRLR